MSHCAALLCALAFAGAGYGSFRFDQVGHGSSRPKPGQKDPYSGDAEVPAEIPACLRSRSECRKFVVAGESAVAYVTSLAAGARARADAYLFLGGFRQTVSLERRREELENPPDEMSAYVQSPALALAGTCDLSVAPHQDACAVAVMQRAGNLPVQDRSQCRRGS